MTHLVEPFGTDCFGNPTGYRVAEYGPRGHFVVLFHRIADLYKPGSHKAAHQECVDWLEQQKGEKNV